MALSIHYLWDKDIWWVFLKCSAPGLKNMLCPGLPVAAVCRDGSEKQQQVRQQNCPEPLLAVIRHLPRKMDCPVTDLWLPQFRRQRLCCQQERVCRLRLQGVCTRFKLEVAREARLHLLRMHRIRELCYSFRNID